MDRALVAFSPEMFEDLARLRAFLHERMYRHYRVNRTRSQARRMLAEMFKLFMAEPETCCPTNGRPGREGCDEAGRARAVCDYIAGMTDTLRHRGAPPAVPPGGGVRGLRVLRPAYVRAAPSISPS